MTTVAGASQYLNAAKIQNSNSKFAGSINAAGTSLMSSSAVDVLEIGRSSFDGNGVGMSARSRAYAKQFMNATKSGFNAIFGMSTIKTSSIEIMTMQINALRSKTPLSQLSEEVRGKIFNEKV